MAQGGSVTELLKSAFDGVNDSAFDLRATRGGDISDGFGPLTSGNRATNTSTHERHYIGFRVATVPEPSTCARTRSPSPSAQRCPIDLRRLIWLHISVEVVASGCRLRANARKG
jgi:hypothetical protein